MLDSWQTVVSGGSTALWAPRAQVPPRPGPGAVDRCNEAAGREPGGVLWAASHGPI